MPKITDPAVLQYLGQPTPGIVASSPGAGPKPPSGYGIPGAAPIAPLPGGPDDPRQAAAKAAAEAGARARASTPIEVAGQIAAARAKAAIEMENERSKAALPQRPTASDTMGAKDSIAALKTLRNQLKRSAQEFDRSQRGAGGDPNGGILSRLREYVPAFMSPTNDRFDATVSGLAPLAKQAFRTPGEGASSDRDVQLFLNMLPNRVGTDAGNVQKYRQLGAMIDDKIRGKQGLIGQRPSGNNAPKAARGPVRISGDADYDRLPSGAVFIAPDGSTRRKP